MRFLILLLFAAIAVACRDEVDNSDTEKIFPIKHGIIQINIINRIMILNLTKTGES